MLVYILKRYENDRGQIFGPCINLGCSYNHLSEGSKNHLKRYNIGRDRGKAQTIFSLPEEGWCQMLQGCWAHTVHPWFKIYLKEHDSGKKQEKKK